jgi:PIN domain nuclease of toxin-antitoxin system
MIVLDTHAWVWWVHGDRNLPEPFAEEIGRRESEGLGVSAISCWEVAKLVEYGRLVLPYPVEEWMEKALAYPSVRLLELTPRIAIESTRLPAPFHTDPADQIIVATARTSDSAVVTLDGKIRAYSHVRLLL